MHDRLTARHTPAIRQALSGLIRDPHAAAEEALHAFPDPSTIRTVLDRHLHRPSSHALTELYLDGWSSGVVSGLQVMRHVEVPALHPLATLKDDPPVPTGGLDSFDWSTWTPGDNHLARALLAGGTDAEALQSLLDQADVTITSITDGRMGYLARALSDAIANGATVDDLGDVIHEIVDDPDRALMIAQTEMTRAVTAGAMDTYQSMGVLYMSFLSAEDAGVCPLCTENEEAGVIPIWDSFPNGAPPVHPRCRCTVVPESGPQGDSS